MNAPFARSLRIHSALLRDALRPGQALAAPLGVRRTSTLAAAVPPYLALQACHWLGFGADALCFRSARQQPLTSPLFVLGIPRSGTTFVHRLLAEDAARFTTMTTWQAVLAPSISERLLWQGVGRVDRLAGAPMRRLRDALTRWLAGDFDAIHEVGLDDAEEDYLALLPFAACFIMALAFPDTPALWRLAALDRETDAEERTSIMQAYRSILQKHCYASGGQRQLLSKNAAFASWAGALAEAFPDARFIICLRDPASALASQISAIEPGRRLFAVDPERRHLGPRFAERFAGQYRHLEAQLQAHPERMVAVDQADLRAAPGQTLRSALRAIGFDPSEALADAFERADAEAARGQQSRHVHDVTEADRPDPALLRDMQDCYQRMCAQAARPAAAPSSARKVS